jgi:hypothetical protein
MKITPTTNIQEVTHLEEFEFEFRDRKVEIKMFLQQEGEIFDLQKAQENSYMKFFVEFINKVSNFIPDGSEVIDIGAFDADTSIPLSLAAGSNGRCINFECGPAWSRLQINTALNPSLNNVNYNYAASNKNKIEVYNYSNSVGGSKHKTDRIGNYPQKRLVNEVNISQLLDKLNLTNLSLIKSDTEGFDVQILFFLEKQIDKFRPVVHIEWFPTTENELIKFLTDKNYFSVDFSTFKKFDILPNYWIQDLLLIPKEKSQTYNHLFS